MSENALDSPVAVTGRALRGTWNTILSIYYANSRSWRVLKAGALFFLGCFVWAGSNVLLSYLADVWVLRYARSYGFVLIAYGPFHHLVVIPIYQRLRKQGRHLSIGKHLHLPNASLAVFLALVIVLGTFPLGVMTIDFTSALGESGPDIAYEVSCTKSPVEGDTIIHCHLTESQGIDRIVVTNGGETIATDEEPPFEFEVAASELRRVTDSKRIRVTLLDADGNIVRRFTRTLSMIPSDRTPAARQSGSPVLTRG